MGSVLTTAAAPIPMPAPLIIVLDFASAAEAVDLVNRLGPEADHDKVGLQLLTAAGRISCCHES